MSSAQDIEEIARFSLLYDFYGQLLTERQRMVFELYHGENLSLAEIAEEFGISRQGVHDALRSAQKALDGYEDKLGLVQRFFRAERAVQEIDAQIETMIGWLDQAEAAVQTDTEEGQTPAALSQETAGDLIRRLKKIRSIIDRLEE